MPNLRLLPIICIILLTPVIAMSVLEEVDLERLIGPSYDENPLANEQESLEDVRQYYEEGSYSWCIESAEYYIANYPIGYGRAEVEYNLVYSNLMLGRDYTSIIPSLEYIIEYYPNSYYAIKAADLHLDLFTANNSISSSRGYRWEIYVEEYLGIYDERDNKKRTKIKTKSVENALKIADSTYFAYVKGRQDKEARKLVDTNICNHVTTMKYLGLYDEDDDREFKKFDSFFSSVEKKEMSDEMRAVLAFYRAVIYLDCHPVDKKIYKEYKDNPLLSSQIVLDRYRRAEEQWRLVIAEYPQSKAALAARGVLANYKVTVENNPEGTVRDFEDIIASIGDEHGSDYITRLIEDLKAPSLSCTNCENDTNTTPQLNATYYSKGYSELQMKLYPVNPADYFDISNKLRSVDLILKGDQIVRYDEFSFGKWTKREKLRLHRIKEVNPTSIDELTGVGEALESWTVSTGYQDDLRPVETEFELDEIESGMYILEASGNDGNLCRSLFMQTEVSAISAADEDGIYVQLVDKSNGEPVEITDLAIFDYNHNAYEKREYSITPRGYGVYIDYGDINWEKPIIIVFDSIQGPAILNSIKRRYAREGDTESAFIYTDKPLYQPGQEINYKAFLRTADNIEKVIAPIVGEEVEIIIEDPKRNEVVKIDGVTDEFGVCFGKFELPDDAKLGRYYAYVEWLDDDNRAGYGSRADFRLEEFEKPEYELSVIAEKDRYLSGEDVQLKAIGTYYFGDPMTGSKVQYEVFRSGKIKKKDKWGRYESESRKIVKTGEGVTDEAGEFIIEWSSDYAGKFDNSFAVNITLTDPSNQEIESGATIYTHRVDRSVAIKTGKNKYHPGDAINTTVNLKDWYGKGVTGDVRVEVYTTKRDEKTYENKRDKQIYKEEHITNSDGKIDLVLEFPDFEPETRLLLLVEAKDSKGTTIDDTTIVTIVAEEEETERPIPELDITVDKKTPLPGSTIDVTIRSRYEGLTAGLLIYGSDFEDFVNLPLLKDDEDGYSAVYPIEIVDAMIPSVKLTATLFYEGRYLKDSLEARINNVNLDMFLKIIPEKQEYTSSDGTASVIINASDFYGSPVTANVSLAAIDDALLAIESDETQGLAYSFDRLLEYYDTARIENSLNVTGNLKNSSYRYLYYTGFEKNMLLNRTPDKRTPVELLTSIDVPNLTLDTALAALGFPNVDYLDVETYKTQYTPSGNRGYYSRGFLINTSIYSERGEWVSEPEFEMSYDGKGSGSVSGLVADENGIGVPGALVVVKGANLFATSSTDGYFVINGVPVGTYDVKASRVGYSEMTYSGVRVMEGLRTNVSFTLSSATAGTVTIEAGVPDIIMDETTTTRTIGSEDFDTQVTDDFGDMLDRTPGIATEDMGEGNLHIRGGRGNEIAYIVDGVNMGYSPATLRLDFRDIAYWKPDIITGKDGTAEVEIELPDNLTTWRLIALGMDKGQKIGWGTDYFIVSKKIIARIKAPRHLVKGDTTEVRTIAHSYYEDPKQARIEMKCKGLELIAGETSLVKEVTSESAEYVPYTYKALEEGTAAFEATVSTDVESDAITHEIPVLPYGMLQRQAYAGRIRNEISLDIILPDKIDPETFEGEVSFSPSVADILSQGLPYFEDYPYNCVEQTSNRFLINALLAEVAADIGLDKSELSEGLEGAINDGVEMLDGQQNDDGGWSWFRGGKTSPYITAYVLDGLYALEDSPFVEGESEDMLKRMRGKGSRYLKKYVNDLRKNNDRYDRELSLYIAEVGLKYGFLDKDSEVLESCLNKYYKSRDPMSDRGLVGLGILAHYMDDSEKVGVILRNLDNTAELGIDETMYWGKAPEECWRWWDDNIEATCKVLDLKLLAEPDSPQIPYLVDWLVDQRRGNRWKSTKDSSEATKTLIRYLTVRPEASSLLTMNYIINDDNRNAITLDPTDFDTPDRSMALELGDFLVGSNDMSLNRLSGEGPVFYSTYLEYYTEADEIPAVGGTVAIERNYSIVEKREEGGKLVSELVPLDRPLKVGEELEVEVVINTPFNFDYAIVEDPRPAGCIFTDTKSGYNGWMSGYVELRTEKRVVLYEHLREGTTRYNYRLKAEVPGDYAVLPATIMGMYSPDIGSSTASLRVKVE